MIGCLSASASAREAKVYRRSWMLMSCSPAPARMLCHAPSMSARCISGFTPGMTHGLLGSRGKVASEVTWLWVDDGGQGMVLR